MLSASDCGRAGQTQHLGLQPNDNYVFNFDGRLIKKMRTKFK